MACIARTRLVEETAKRIRPEMVKNLKKDYTGPEIKAKINAAAEAIVAKGIAAASKPVTPKVSAAIRQDASTAPQPLKKDRPIVQVSKEVKLLNEAYIANPSNDSAQAVINGETAYGYRNINGEMIVNLVDNNTWDIDITKRGTKLAHVSRDTITQVTPASASTKWLGLHVGTQDVVTSFAMQFYPGEDVALHTVTITEDLNVIKLRDTSANEWNPHTLRIQLKSIPELSDLKPSSSVTELSTRLQELGYDAVIYENTWEGNGLGRANSLILLNNDKVSITSTQTTQEKVEGMLSKGTTAIGSSSSPFTNDQVEDYYIDTDGTMTKAYRVNEALVEVDKANEGLNYSEANSTYLTETLEAIAAMTSDIHTTDVNVTAGVMKTMSEAHGKYNPDAKTIDIQIDDNGPGAEFRSKFSMGNQEVYVHELVHSVMDFLFDGSTEVAKKPDVVALYSKLEAMHTAARKKSTWEDLLPGYKDNAQYTEVEIQQAKDKWDYIFDNEQGNDVHEFMAALLTNEMFREGMKGIKNLDINETDPTASAIEKLRTKFMNMLEKMLGWATGRKNASITEAGSELVFNIMRANYAASETAINYKKFRTVNAVLDKTSNFIKKTNTKVAKALEPITSLGESLFGIGKDAEKLGVISNAELLQFEKSIRKIESNYSGVKMQSSNKEGLMGMLENTYEVLKGIVALIRSLGHFYTIRKIGAKNKNSRIIGERIASSMDRMLTTIGFAADGAIRTIANDFIDKPGVYNFLTDAILRLTQHVDEVRQAAYEGVLRNSNEWFGDVAINNDRLNVNNNAAIGDVVLRADIQALGITAEELLELLENPQDIKAAVKDLSKGLTAHQLADAMSLAKYMTTGVGTATNAYNIARGAGTDTVTSRSETDVEVINKIDKLVSFLALDLTDKDAKDTLKKFMNGDSHIDYSKTMVGKAKKLAGIKGKALDKETYTAQVLEGVNHFIISARGVQAASEIEMRTNDYKRIKGYVKDTFNDKYSLEWHPVSERRLLERNGYKFVKLAAVVPGSNTQYAMFVSNAPDVKRANGALGLQDRKSRGFTLQDMINRESEGLDQFARADRFRKLLESTTRAYNQDRLGVNMHPVYGDNGKIVDFRMTMSTKDKIRYLGLETKGTENLARTFGTMGTASATTTHNVGIIDALWEDTYINYKGNEHKYATIEPAGLDGNDYDIDSLPKNANKYERLWARLPSETKKYARERFGSNKIIIRKDALVMAFGEENWSATDSRLLARMSPKMKGQLQNLEAYWQDIMQIAKGNIVIKIPAVLVANVWSNAKILLYTGVHPIVGTKLMITAQRELKRYEADKYELGTLLREQKGGVEGHERRIAKLTKGLSENTVTPLVDAGLFQSIVEDVSTSSDNNRIANFFNDKLDKAIPNETINSAVQLLFLTQKTKPYQQLLKATQVSDFYFRYAQYYNAIQNNGHSEKRAMKDAIDNYINYEAPLEKHVRYMDAMGPFFFIKYFVKVQRVVKKLFKKHPAAVTADIILQTFATGDTPDVLDNYFLDKNFSTFSPLKMPDRFIEFASPALLDVVWSAKAF